MRRSHTIVSTAAAAITLAVLTSSAASAGSHRGPVLEGRAVLDATALADGPPSGAGLVPVGQTQTVINGIEFPRPSQPVIGFSALLDGRRRGEYLAMPDNGFGGKANSFDFLVRAYYLGIDFKTERGGTGSVEVRDFIQFSDPNGLIGFPIVKAADPQRPLTGADIDPESLQRDGRGGFWMGEEFGPWILHFDRNGVLLAPPFALPDGLFSPNNPLVPNAATTFTQPNSRGIEAMAMTPNGKFLYVVLEGATRAEAPSTRRRVFEFSTRDEAFTGRTWDYRTQMEGNFVADAVALDRHRLAIIERDGGRGVTANFRQVRVVDLRDVDPATGALRSTEVVDLAAVPDPDLISLPARYPGDVGLGDPFRVTCESVEAIHLLEGTRLMIGCDNNLPNDGRNPTRADDSEFIVVEVPGLRGGV